MIIEQSKQIISEINRAFIGKNEVIEKVLMTIYAGGHVLLEDCPGVGKTTLAVAFSRVLGLSTRRIQFTPDTLPSDITGFTMWNRRTSEFEYREGAANCQLLLADEINRTSPKTQSALLEVMEERTITVDGETHALPALHRDAESLRLCRHAGAPGEPARPLHGLALDRLSLDRGSDEDHLGAALRQSA